MSKSLKIKSRYPGVRYYLHDTRLHKGKPDKYFSIRYRFNHKQREEGAGWSSEGWTEDKAASEIFAIKQAIKTGNGEISLKAKREKKVLEIENAAQEAFEHERAKKTFNEVWSKYFPFQQSNVTARSWKRETSLYKLWIFPVVGEIPMKDINQLHLQKIKKSMEKKEKSARSISYALDVIRQVFNFAIKNNLIDNLNSPTRMFKKPRKDNKRHRSLEYNEAVDLLNALKNKSKSLYEISLVSLHCGLRAGEIFALRFSDIDLINNRITVRDTKGGMNRFQYMTDQVKQVLEQNGVSDTDKLVFPDRKGNKRVAIPKQFSQVVNEIGLNNGISDPRDKFVFHSLRHTYASWLVQQGIPIYDVSKLLGHSTISMTERYAHLSPSNYKNSAKVIDSITKQSAAVIQLDQNKKIKF